MSAGAPYRWGAVSIVHGAPTPTVQPTPTPMVQATPTPMGLSAPTPTVHSDRARTPTGHCD